MLPVDQVEKFSNYPAYSWAIATIGVIATAFAMYRTYVKSMRETNAPKAARAPAAGEMCFDGPIAEALRSLKEIATALAPMRDVVPLLKEQHNEAGARMREDRSKIYDRIEEERSEVDARIEQERREVDAEVSKQGDRLNELGERLARIEGGQAIGRRPTRPS